MGCCPKLTMTVDGKEFEETMDDIAEEVQRISGTTFKMTTSQILTALQAIPATDEGTT